jgi:DNA-directed RNA polymerase subunit M/transcription elongation factor TFIIS
MEFCEVCDNLLYLSESAEEGAAPTAPSRFLTKYCKNCGFTKQLDIQRTGAIRVAKSLYSEDDLLYMQYKNKYLRYDNTLQRVRDPKLRCPSEECPAEKGANEVLYVKYHPLHMRYLFCCDTCGTTWRK